MNLINYILFNCSNTSIEFWKVINHNNQNFLLFSTSISGNHSLFYQALSDNCSTPTLLSNKNYIGPFPTINFLTNDSLVATWLDRETPSSNILGHGTFLYLNGTIDGSIFTLGNTSLQYQNLASAPNPQGGVDLVFIETSISNNSLIGYHFNDNNYNVAYAIKIKETEASSLLLPDIINLDNGSTIVTWQQRVDIPTNDWNVYVQPYFYNFSNPQNIFLINKNTTGFQGKPSMASTNNTILIAWNSLGQIDNLDVFFKILDVNGTTILDETLANNYTILAQNVPKVAGTHGVYGITWTSGLQDGDQGGVYAQLVYSNGTKIGQEFRVNTITVGNQRDPQILVDGYNLIFTWLGPYMGRDILYGANIDVRQFLNVPHTHTKSKTTSPSTTQTDSLSESPTDSDEYTTSTSLTRTGSTSESSTYSRKKTITALATRSHTTTAETISISPTITATSQHTSSESVLIPHNILPKRTVTKNIPSEEKVLPKRTVTKNIPSEERVLPKKQFIIPTETISTTNTISQVTSVASLSLTNIAVTQRVAITNNAIRCQASDQNFHATPMAWPDNIFQISIGGTELRYIHGALLGAWASRLAILLVHFLAAKRFGNAKLHYPGGQIFSTTFFYASTTLLEAIIYRFGNSLERLFAFFSSLAQLTIPIYYLWHFHRDNFGATASIENKSPWIYKKIQSILKFLPESYTLDKWHSIRDGTFVEEMGKSFEDYKDEYRNFLIADLFTGSVLGAISSFAMQDQQNQCYPSLIATTITQSLYTTAIISFRPFNGMPNNFYFSTIASLQASTLIMATAQYKSPYLQNSTATQSFIEITPIIVQTIITLRSVIDLGVFAYSIYKKFKIAQSVFTGTDIQEADFPLLEVPKSEMPGYTTVVVDENML